VLAKKKKLSKKQIKEDKLVTSFYNARTFYEDNQSKVLMVLGAVAAVIVAIIWYNSKITQDNQSAAVELSRIYSIYESGSFQEAIDGQPGTNITGLKSIVDNYGGSEQGETARIYLANSYYFLGDYQNAKDEYDSYSGSNMQLVASAYAGIAACYEADEDYNSAADFYLKAAEVYEYNPMNADNLLNSGKNYIKSKDYGKAEEILGRIKDDYAQSAAARDVDRYLALVNTQ
jgi:tetratricopeptide (TPR) repeat protein